MTADDRKGGGEGTIGMTGHRYDLVYFNIYAFAEPIKMLMTHLGLTWHYHMPWDFFGRNWNIAKPDVAFGELPVLVVDGDFMLWESAAILRFLADGTALLPTDAMDRARADAILDSCKRFVMPVDAVVNIRFGERFETEKATTLGDLPLMLAPFLRELDRLGGPFFLGAAPSVCDFAFFHHLDMMLKLDAATCDSRPALDRFHRAMTALPGVGSYLDERPPLTGIGTDPRIEVNGVMTPTMAGR